MLRELYLEKNSNDMNKAFDYYTKCAILSCNLKDYSSVISCYKTVLELINIKTINPVIQQFWIFWQLMLINNAEISKRLLTCGENL